FGSTAWNTLSITLPFGKVAVSVSCLRINCLEQKPGRVSPGLSRWFQYPVFGSTAWNTDSARASSPPKLCFCILSSDQLLGTLAWHSGQLRANGFSILSSDQLLGTFLVPAWDPTRQPRFQYPVFGSTAWNNRAASKPAARHTAFQYPVFGSTAWN